jgi:toxin CcdB
MAQFDVHRLAGGALVVDLQIDLIGLDATRIVAPLRAEGRYAAFRGLTPMVEFEAASWIVRLQEMAAVPASALGRPVGSLTRWQDEIKQGVDVLCAGSELSTSRRPDRREALARTPSWLSSTGTARPMFNLCPLRPDERIQPARQRRGRFMIDPRSLERRRRMTKVVYVGLDVHAETMRWRRLTRGATVRSAFPWWSRPCLVFAVDHIEYAVAKGTGSCPAPPP